jgi:hypothetical protein
MRSDADTALFADNDFCYLNRREVNFFCLRQK